MKRTLSVLLALAFVLTLVALPTSAMAKDELKNTDPDKYYIVLDLNNQVVTVYEKDDAGEYTRIVRRFICSTGKDKPSGEEAYDDSTPTPSGIWKIGGRERFGKFANFSEYARYWTQLVQDIYFHSILFSKRDLTTAKSGSYGALGGAASHGCIRLLVEDAKWLYYYACPGTTVEVTKSLPSDRGLKSALRAQRNETKFKLYKEMQMNFFDNAELPNDKAWVTHDNAALRKESKANAKLIHSLTLGEELEILLYNDAWVKVRDMDGKEGYVYRGYISLTEGKTDTREDANVIKATTWMFSEKDDAVEKRICKVPTDTTVRVLEVDKATGFTKIEYYTETGYVLSKFLKAAYGIDMGDQNAPVVSTTPTPAATATPEITATPETSADVVPEQTPAA
ncbi:MAG: SH3 domain-containing protein [Clostridium sp.]|nr:SH3 domain-containing protein [Clostridium sp.]